MQHPTCTVRTYALRVGTRRLALEIFGCTVGFMGGLSVIAVLIGEGDKYGVVGSIIMAAFILGLWALAGCLLLAIAPRQIIRVSPSGIHIRSFSIYRSARILCNEIESCFLNKNGIMIFHRGRTHHFNSGLVKSDHWPELRDTIEYYLNEHFGLTIESEVERRASQRPQTIGQFIRDKLLLLTYAGLIIGPPIAGMFLSIATGIPVHPAVIFLVCACISSIFVYRLKKYNEQANWTPIQDRL